MSIYTFMFIGAKHDFKLLCLKLKLFDHLKKILIIKETKFYVGVVVSIVKYGSRLSSKRSLSSGDLNDRRSSTKTQTTVSLIFSLNFNSNFWKTTALKNVYFSYKSAYR